jgi:endoglucanase
MDEKALQEVLMELSRTAGVSGQEGDAVAVASRCLQPFVTKVERDRFGNLIAFKQGEETSDPPFSLVLAAHIDEIGAMVTKVDESGFLRFTGIGGIDPRVLLGQAVEVHGRNRLKGVIGALAPHLLTEKERQKELKMEELYIDIGFDEAQATEQVRVGDFVSLAQAPLAMQAGGCISGKSLDNRAGVAALIVCAAELAGVRHRCNVYFTATLQEEVGLRGAITAAYGLVPDLAIAVDVTHGEWPGLSYPEVFELGKGPAIGLGPNFHPALTRSLEDSARENRFPYQVEPVPGVSGTDAWVFQVSREGIPTALLSVPLRYMHTPVELLNLDDLLNAGRLLAVFARRLDRPFVEGLKCI